MSKKWKYSYDEPDYLKYGVIVVAIMVLGVAVYFVATQPGILQIGESVESQETAQEAPEEPAAPAEEPAEPEIAVTGEVTAESEAGQTQETNQTEDVNQTPEEANQTVEEEPAEPEAPQNGLKGQYYSNTELEGDATVAYVDNLDETWTDDPAEGVSLNGFSARWSGQLIVEDGAKYYLTLLTDDGSRMWINGEKIVDSWIKDGGARARGSSIGLAEGTHDIVVEMWSAGAQAQVQLNWESNELDMKQETIPGKFFLPKS